jgi:predicted aspartyl protease
MGEFSNINAGVAASPAAPLLDNPDPNSGKGAQQLGQAVVDVGVKLQAAKKRTDDGRDTVLRSRSFDEFTNLITAEQMRLETEGDPTDPDMGKNFGLFLKENYNRLMSDHQGVASSEESVTRLSGRLNNLQALASRQVGAAVIKAGRNQVRSGMAQNIGQSAIDAGQSGDLAAGYDGVDEEVAEAAKSLSPAEEKAAKQTGYAQVLTEVFETHMSVNNTEMAKAILASPGAEKLLGPKAFRKHTNDIIKIEYAAEKGAREGQQVRAKAATTLGMAPAEFEKKWTTDQKFRDDPDVRQLMGLDRTGNDPIPPITNMPKAIALYEKTFDKKPDEKAIQDMRVQVMENAGLEMANAESGPFKDTLKGSMMNQIIRIQPLLASGELDPNSQDARILEFAVMQLQVPVRTGTDQTTNQPIFSQGSLPPSIVEAYKMAKIPIPRPAKDRNGNPVPSGGVEGEPASGSSVEANAVQYESKWTLSDGTVIDPRVTAIAPEQTLFGRLGVMTGIGSGLEKTMAESTLGGAVGFTSEEATKASSDIEKFAIKLADILSQGSDVRAVAARADIIKKMDMKASMGSKSTLRTKMFSVADHIISVIKKDVGVLTTASDPKTVKKATSEMLGLKYLLAELGVPRLVTSAAELEGIQPGTLVRTPSGSVYPVKAKGE